jgi:peptidyl-tRNA hydrolase, PTH1 family
MSSTAAGDDPNGASTVQVVVLGLGNPGAEFEGTRHNVGADVVTLLAQRHGDIRLRRPKGQRAKVGEARIASSLVGLAIPTTFMNDSGTAAAGLLRRFHLDDVTRLVVIHDELDLEPGRLKIKVGGGSAGHNGLRSLRQHLHSGDFVRIRIGIGKPPSAAAGATYVLRRPQRSQRDLLDASITSAADALEVLVRDGVDSAMNQFNG